MHIPIVSTTWLHQNIQQPNLVVLDASLEKTVSGKVSNFKNKQIETARLFDLKLFSDTNSPLPNTIPSKEKFEEEAQKLGINTDSTIVVYDTIGVYTSPRVWWLFRIFGHEKVYVLNGGLPQWIQEGFKTEQKTPITVKKGNFKAVFNSKLITYFEEVKYNINSEEFQVIDARSNGRFDGTSPEPRPILKSGNITNSINIPYQEVLENNKLKSKKELITIFKGINKKPLVFSCGSGLTACILLLASEIVLPNHKSVYDGSWTEWATLNKLTNEK